MCRTGVLLGFRFVVSLGLCLVARGSAHAQGDFLTQLYGSGVHAYFARDYRGAREALSAAIDAGTVDPRCYYFRGLSLMRIGRDAAAANDFARGAELEATGGGRVYNINDALRRVQGEARMVLERHRAAARVEKRKRLADYRANRYARIRAAEPVVTSPVPFDTSGEDRGTLVAPLTIPEPATGPSGSEPADETMPPDAGTEPNAAPTTESPATGEMPAETASEPVDDPFPAGEPPKPQQPDDPDAGDAAEEMPEKTPDKGETPAADPFAADPKEMPAAKEPDAPKEPANDDEADDDDPFAHDPDE